MNLNKLLKCLCAVLIFSAMSMLTVNAATEIELDISQTATEKKEIVHFDEPINARGKLLSVGFRLDSVMGNAELYLDGTGICIKTDLSKSADTIITSEGTRGNNDSGYFATDNTQIHALQFYIPDSSDIVTIFLDGQMIGEELINNVTEKFSGLSAMVYGPASVLYVDYVKVTDMPGTITAAFADDEKIAQLSEDNYPVVYLDEGIARTITMPVTEGVDENLFSHWTDADGNSYDEHETTQITKTTIFTAVYDNNGTTYIPQVIGGLVEVSGRYFYEDFYDKDATALTVTFSPLGRAYNTITATAVEGKTQESYEPRSVSGTTISTDGYVRYGIIIDEIVDADAFTVTASDVQ